MQGGQVRWGQGNDRSRSGSVRQAFFWPDNPWWGQKLAERKDAVQRVRAAEGYRGRDVRPRSFAQTGNCVAVGPRGSVCREGCSSLPPFEALADGRGETRLSQKEHGSPPRAGFPAEPWDSGECLASGGTSNRVGCFMRRAIAASSLASSSRLQQRQRQWQRPPQFE